MKSFKRSGRLAVLLAAGVIFYGADFAGTSLLADESCQTCEAADSWNEYGRVAGHDADVLWGGYGDRQCGPYVGDPYMLSYLLRTVRQELQGSLPNRKISIPWLSSHQDVVYDEEGNVESSCRHGRFPLFAPHCDSCGLQPVPYGEEIILTPLDGDIPDEIVPPQPSPSDEDVNPFEDDPVDSAATQVSSRSFLARMLPAPGGLNSPLKLTGSNAQRKTKANNGVRLALHSAQGNARRGRLQLAAAKSNAVATTTTRAHAPAKLPPSWSTKPAARTVNYTSAAPAAKRTTSVAPAQQRTVKKIAPKKAVAEKPIRLKLNAPAPSKATTQNRPRQNGLRILTNN